MSDIAWIKLAVLANGIATTPDFGNWFAHTTGYVRRRNFYNSPNWGDSGAPSAPPQEFRLRGELPVTVALNNYGRSQWQLTWSEASGPLVISDAIPEGFPAELVTDLTAVRNGSEIARVCNLYGGSALSFFSPRACYFFADGTQCRFCSLDGTSRENGEFAARVTPKEMRAAVTEVVAADREMINQLMIVGGNERNLDRGFRNQVELVYTATEALSDAGLMDKVSVHLIAMPPRDLRLIDALRGLPNVHVGFNLEVWDPDRFVEITPGKAADYGQGEILTALDRLRDSVGSYRAHSILIAGLEPPDTIIRGARHLAEQGISPIINVYHSDRHSSLGLSIRPTYRRLTEIAVGVQELHDTYPIQPYWKGCGRNAIDFEASLGMFRTSPPAYN